MTAKVTMINFCLRRQEIWIWKARKLKIQNNLRTKANHQDKQSLKETKVQTPMVNIKIEHHIEPKISLLEAIRITILEVTKIYLSKPTGHLVIDNQNQNKIKASI